MPRVLSVYNTGVNTNANVPGRPNGFDGNANLNKWYDFVSVWHSTVIRSVYFYFRGDVYHMRVFPGESGNFQINGCQIWRAVPGVGWSVDTGGRLPTHVGGYPAPASTLVNATLVEDRAPLAGCPAVAWNGADVGAAYSLRLLDNNYAGAVVRVRRSTDNALVDLYAAPAGVLLATPTGQDYAAWLSSSAKNARGFVMTWYDQSGSGNRAEMDDVARQPELVFEASSQRYCIYFAGRTGANGTSRGLVFNSRVDTCGVSMAFRTDAVHPVDDWQTYVATDLDNFGMRGSSSAIADGLMFTDFSSTSAGGIATINGYAGRLSFLPRQWNHVIATRPPGLAMPLTRIAMPGDAGLDSRAFRGHMFELILLKSQPGLECMDRIYENRPIQADPELFEYPPATIAHAPLLLPPGSITESVGITATASSTLNAGTAAGNAIDFNSVTTWWSSANGAYAVSTGVYAGAVSTATTTAGARTGEWLQMNLYRARTLIRFDLYLGGAAGAHKLRKYCVVGSNDGGSSWTIVHDQTATNLDLANQTWLSLAVPVSTPFAAYRWIFSELVGNNTTILSVHELRPVFEDAAFDCTASSAPGGAFLAFDGENSNAASWGSSGTTYAATTGAYTGAATTTAVHPVTGVSAPIAGEWLQLRLPRASSINGLRVNPVWGIASYSIVGSDDGSTGWTLVHAQDAGANMVSNVDTTVTFAALTGTTRTFRSYRFIVRSIFGNGTSVNIGVTRLQFVSGGWRKDLADTVTGIGGAVYAKYKTAVSAGSYGLGEYVAYANSVSGYTPTNRVLGESPPSGAFDKLTLSTEFQSAMWGSAEANMPDQNGPDVADPPWIALKTPRAITVREYSVATAVFDVGVANMPTKWELQGSPDGASWTTIDARSNVLWPFPSGIGSTQAFTVPSNSSAYDHHRLVAYRSGFVNHRAIIAELRLYALEGPTPRLLSYPPPGVPDGGSWARDVADTVPGLSGSNYLTYKTTLSGLPYGNGQYRAYANSIFSYSNSTAYSEVEWPASGAFDGRVTLDTSQSSRSRDAHHAFEGGITPWVTDAGLYVFNTGAYLGAERTAYNGNLVAAGEWLQIRTSPRILKFFSMWTEHPERGPAAGVLLGSTDGTAWTLIDAFSGYSSGSYGSGTVARTLTPTGNAFTFFRLVLTQKTNSGQSGWTWAGINWLRLVDVNDNNVNGIQTGWTSAAHDRRQDNTVDAGANAAWVALRTPQAIAVREYSLSARGYYFIGSSPATWQLQASSNSGSNWQTLDARSNVQWLVNGERKRFVVAASAASNAGLFADHRLVVQRTQASNVEASIGDLQLHALP
jgi:hypothetical protein